jgi:transcriptional regulator with XRE-family HTH domain
VQQFEAQEIGARIRQARLERGLTQESLAEMASFSKRSLQDYEAGQTIPYRQLREFSRLLNRPEEWFLYGDEKSSGLDEDRLREIVREELEAALAPIRERLGDDMPRAASA